LNREWLIEQRKTVFDEFRREIESCKSFEIDKNTKKTLFKNFIINYTNRQNGYISFRKYIITKWLNEML
jgi:ribosomal protein L17